MAKLLGNTTIGDKRLLHIYLDVGEISETRYYKIATIDRGNGILQINGILGGRAPTDGRGLVNVSFALINLPEIWGNVSGHLKSSDIIVYVPNNIFLPGEVWLKVTTWGLVNLEVVAVRQANIVYDGTYTTSPPSSSSGTLYYLSKNYSGIYRSLYSFSSSFPLDFVMNYTLGPGVSVVNSDIFLIFAVPTTVKNTLLEIVISPQFSSATEAGFKGEGIINLSFYPISEVLGRLGISNTTGGIYRLGGALTGYSIVTSENHDNNYFLYGISVSSETLTISVQRNRYTSSDYANVPTGVVYLSLVT